MEPIVVDFIVCCFLFRQGNGICNKSLLSMAVTVLLSFCFSCSFSQIFTSASYLLSDLYSPDDVHALPALNPTDQTQTDDNEELAHDKNSSGDFADENQADSAMASKVISAKFLFVLVLL